MSIPGSANAAESGEADHPSLLASWGSETIPELEAALHNGTLEVLLRRPDLKEKEGNGSVCETRSSSHPTRGHRLPGRLRNCLNRSIGRRSIARALWGSRASAPPTGELYDRQGLRQRPLHSNGDLPQLLPVLSARSLHRADNIGLETNSVIAKQTIHQAGVEYCHVEQDLSDEPLKCIQRSLTYLRS